MPQVFPLNEESYLVYRYILANFSQDRLNRLVDRAIAAHVKQMRRRPSQSTFGIATVRQYLNRKTAPRGRWTNWVLAAVGQALQRLVARKILAALRPELGLTTDDVEFHYDDLQLDFSGAAADEIIGARVSAPWGPQQDDDNSPEALQHELTEVAVEQPGVALLQLACYQVRFANVAAAVLIALDRFADDKLLPPEERAAEAAKAQRKARRQAKAK